MEGAEVKHHGCYNKPILSGHWVTHVTVPNPESLELQQATGQPIYIEHAMTRTCQWIKENDDPTCAGCCRRDDGA
jgi:hypothetical protein